MKADTYYDLLDVDLELRLRANPKIFWEELSSLKDGSTVVVDEIQKLPELLNYVQMGIENKKLQFFLSGSSARKLKKGKANLLGGRALDLKLHPLSMKELGSDFNIHSVLSFGALPAISKLILKKKKKEAIHHLRAYFTLYIKEEVQAEALVRKLDAFQRFLQVAAQSNAQMINFQNISREASVNQNTVKDYYSILEDTLIGHFVWPFDRSERRKARPKFYFFDCGVLRAMQDRLEGKPSPEELSFLFETFIANELRKIRDYTGRNHRISLWRKGHWEVDFLIESGNKPILAIECKSGKQRQKKKYSQEAFQKDFPKVPFLICSLTIDRKRKLGENLWEEPYKNVLDRYRKLCSKKS